MASVTSMKTQPNPLIVSPTKASSSTSTGQLKRQIIENLRENFHNKSYDESLEYAKDNLEILSTERHFLSKVITKVLHTELTKSTQEMVLILVFKKYPEFKNDVANLTSEAIKEVLNDLVLKETTGSGRRVYDTSNRSEDNYKHQIISAIEYSPHFELKAHFTAGIDRLNEVPLVIPEQAATTEAGSLNLMYNDSANLYSKRTDKLNVGMDQKIFIKKTLDGLINQKINHKKNTLEPSLTHNEYRDILDELHKNASVSLKRTLENAGFKVVSKYSLYSNSRAKSKIEALKKLLEGVPTTPTLLPYSDNHYTFFSTDTHIISGLVALSDGGSDYSIEASIDSVFEAMGALAPYSDSNFHVYHQGNKLSCNRDESIVEGQDETDIKDKAAKVIEVKNAIGRIFPPDNSDKQKIIEFYNHKPVLTFSIDRSRAQYELKPVLVHDKENNRHYLHFEFGGVGTHSQDNGQPTSVMLNFCGNGISQNIQIKTAAKILKQTGVKQIIPIYANKGINLLLNPDLSAATTSIKGSVNPHIMAYNSLVERDPAQPIELQIYAHSYGNLASAKFMERVRETTPDKPIFFIGSATASSLVDIATALVGGLANIADTLKLLNKSNVFNALNNEKTTAIIFNDSKDAIVKANAQIQRHPNFNEKTGTESPRIFHEMNPKNKDRDGNHYDLVYFKSKFRAIYNEEIIKHRSRTGLAEEQPIRSGETHVIEEI
jgi:hypothetical protein